MSSLREKATKGILWSALERFGQQGSAFVVQLVLARLLMPEDFGLIALVIVFIAISRVIVDSGFARAIIQKKEITDADLSTVFYVNVGIGVVVTVLLWLIAPWIARFYEQPQLTEILRYLSFSLVLGSLGGVHQAILNRELKFKALFRVSMPATVIAGAVAIFLAWKDWGVWALVVNMLLVQALRSVFLWMQSHWRPSLVLSFESLGALFPFGSRLALSGVLDQGFQNIYVLVIGKFYPPAEVGYFQRARAFQQLPIANIQAILNSIAFPLFSSIQDDPARIKRGMKKALQIGTFISFSLMAWLAAVAEPMTVVLIGEKWLPLVQYMAPLCVVGALYPMHALNLNVLTALGRSDLFLRLEILKKGMIIVNILITYRLGVLAMIYGMIIASIIGLWINSSYTKSYADYGLGEQLFDIAPMIILSLIIFYGVVCLPIVTVTNVLLEFVFKSMIAGILVAIGLRYMPVAFRNEVGVIIKKISIPFQKPLLYWIKEL